MNTEKLFERSLLEFFSPIHVLLNDQTVSEIMINGPRDIRIERNGCIEKTDEEFPSDYALEAALRNLAQYTGQRLDAQSPILEGRFPDGSRVEAMIAPVVAGGPHVSIRRFAKSVLDLDWLIKKGSLSAQGARYLRKAVVGKRNILISGGTGSGKTSLLNALSGCIPASARVVTIEDARELNLQHDHVVSLQSRSASSVDGDVISTRDLFKASLRMRPDRVVVGELRGGEALDLIQAMTSGHGGCLSTLHATSPIDALGRMETMTLMSDIGLPLEALRKQIASAIDLIVQVDRCDDGSRKVTHISKVEGHTASKGYRLKSISLGAGEGTP